MIAKILLSILIVIASAIVIAGLAVKAIIDKTFEDEICKKCRRRMRYTGYREEYICDHCVYGKVIK